MGNLQLLNLQKLIFISKLQMLLVKGFSPLEWTWAISLRLEPEAG